jgi:hypothetical protein
MLTVFFENSQHKCRLTHKNMAAFLFLSTAEEIIKQKLPFNQLISIINNNILLLERKLISFPNENYWKLLEGIEYSKIIQSFNALQAKGINFKAAEEKPFFLKKEELLFSIKGENLRENQEQKRILSKIRNMEIEDTPKINVQGVAGSGKTTILNNAVTLLTKIMPAAKIIWLSNSIDIVRKFNKIFHSNDHLSAATYLDFCSNLFPPRVIWGEKYQLRMDIDSIINKLGLVGRNIQEKRYSFKIIVLTVNKFCEANSLSFNESMTPLYCQNNKRAIMVEYAKRYWNMIKDKRLMDVPIQQNHHIKYIQSRVKNIKNFTFDLLVIDEAQDVYPAILHIVKCLTGQYKLCQHHNARAIMFGDRYQATNYFNEWGYSIDEMNKIDNKKRIINKYEEKVELLDSSERVSNSAAHLITDTLKSGGHSSDNTVFIGINPRETEIHHCSWSDLESGTVFPKNKTIFLVEDVWSALFAAQLMLKKGEPFFLPRESLAEFESIILGALEFIETGIIIHEEFAGYKNWQDYVMKKSQENILMERISSFFQKGYKQKHLNRTINKMEYSDKKHIISLMKYAKGMECNQIYILPNIRKQNALNGNGSISIKESNELYVALTRTTHKIYMPPM